MKNDAPIFGEYVKLNKTGKIVKCKSYDPTSQLLQIELPTGVITVQRREFDRITTDEEIELLVSRVLKFSRLNQP